jgi:hypothetical protein
MPYRGSAAMAISQIGKLQQLLTRMSDIPRRTAVDAAPKIEALVQAQFRAGTDPYGRSWRRLMPSTIAKGRKPPPLSDTKALRDGTRVFARAAHRAGIVIQLGESYGYFAQVGFRVGKTVVPARRILPQFGLPDSWRRALESSAREMGQRIMKGAA